MTRTGHRAMGGFGLIELLVSVVASLIIVAAVTALAAKSLSSSSDLTRMTRLDQELRGILQVMTRDLKRSGYNSVAALMAYMQGGGGGFPLAFQTFEAVDAAGLGSGWDSCVTYSYDRNDNGTLTASGPQETFGFRLDTGEGAVESLSGATGLNSANCTGGTWENISDIDRVLITDLRFEEIQTDGSLASLGGTLRQRQLLISLTGSLRDDPSVSRTLHESVKIRNNQYMPPP